MSMFASMVFSSFGLALMRRQPCLSTVMVGIGHFYLVGVAFDPFEADPVLIVYPDRVLSLPVALESLQLVVGRRLQIRQGRRGVQKKQFPSSNSFKRLPFLVAMAFTKERFGLLVIERFNHGRPQFTQ